MRRFSVLIVALSIILLIAGCSSDKNEETELELGIEALDNENEKEAKEHFDKATEDDANEAKEYVDAIESAEFINQSVKDDDLDEAIESYQILEEDEKFASVSFIFADEQEELTTMIEKRKKIDEKIDALTDFFDPEDPEMSANELYILKSDDMLEQGDLTSEQEKAIEEFQEAVKKKIEEFLAAKEAEKEETEDKKEPVEKETETETETETDKVEKDKKEEDTQKEPNKDKDKDKDKNKDESQVLSKEEARDLVYKHLYGEDAVYTEGTNFRLEYDHDDDEGKFVFQYYEAVENKDESHTATLGWYAIDPNTREVTDQME